MKEMYIILFQNRAIRFTVTNSTHTDLLIVGLLFIETSDLDFLSNDIVGVGRLYSVVVTLLVFVPKNRKRIQNVQRQSSNRMQMVCRIMHRWFSNNTVTVKYNKVQSETSLPNPTIGMTLLRLNITLDWAERQNQ